MKSGMISRMKSLTVIICVLVAGISGCQSGKRTAMIRPTAEVRPHMAVPAHAGTVSIPGIKWSEWSEEAFARAKAEDKLILLDISATWCHWCEVMEETTYSDPEVIAMVNSEFVPVYVDSDLRPDVNDRYNQGGWPSVAVLTPEGEVLRGGTTMSARDLMVLLSAMKESYNDNRENIQKKLETRREAVKEAREKMDSERRPAPLGPEMPVSVIRTINLFVDPKYGGFGGPEKFPYPVVMEFALAVYPKVKDNKEYSTKPAIELTLDNMAAGLYDPLEGGFFRYSVTQDWKRPHYEKLLELNGDLLGVYMWAYRELGHARYRDIAEGVADYLEATLMSKEKGVFYNSQKADEGYYRLGPEERLKAGGPPVDGTIYAAANAHAALGYLEAYRATGQERYLKVALGVVDYIRSNMYVEGLGVTRRAGGDEDVLHFADQVYTALAAERAYQATGDKGYLDFSLDVSRMMTRKFWDPENGGYFDTHYKDETVGLLGDLKKSQEDNSKAAMLMIDYYYLTGDKVYKQTSRKTLEPFSADYVKYSFWAAPFALAVARCTETTYKFLVVGPKGNKETGELVKKAFMYSDPDRVVVPLDPVADAARLKKEGYEYDGEPAIFVCSDHACFPPVRPGGSMSKTEEYIRRAREQDISR